MAKISLKTDSLAFALQGAAQAVAQVRAGTALPQALADIFARTAAPAARGAIQAIAYRSMRKLGQTDALQSLLARRTPEPPVLHGLLSSALALLVDPDDAPYENHTVVDQAVTAAAADMRMAHAKGLVNAVLRRFLRERVTLLQQVLKKPEAKWNYPRWWIEGIMAAYPNQWQAVLMAGNAPPPLTLRVNRRASTVEQYLDLLAESGMPASRVGPQAVRLEQPLPVEQIPGFGDGLVSVQDAAAQLAAPLLDVRDGMRVLDACAAPGGKTSHLLELANVELLAVDQDPSRLQRVRQNLDRLGLQAKLKVGDASGEEWWDGGLFDRILADVPCTASGVVRRHPDIRWLRRKGDADRLATLSAKILDNLWHMLRPDGRLLFVTCSLWPQESEDQAAAFAARHDAVRLPAPGQLLPGVSKDSDQDGLFYALFQKPAN